MEKESNDSHRPLGYRRGTKKMAPRPSSMEARYAIGDLRGASMEDSASPLMVKPREDRKRLTENKFNSEREKPCTFNCKHDAHRHKSGISI